MSIRFAFLFVAYLAYALSSNLGTKQGSGFDPWGLNPPSQPPPHSDAGGGWGPLG